ncbi:MAG: C4-dicarboxylate ABC transporter [Alphaproteobacteria bacterium]|jgi:tellurite resistance protein|nr:C4-dicarboxylate ABC transporter [Alphaproteobacteria bacterium]
MTAAPPSAAPRTASLADVPVPLFAVGMGLTGLGLAWRQAQAVLGWPGWIGEGVLLLAVLAFAAVSALYAGKAVRHPGAAVADFRHPVLINFFPAFSMSLLLIAAAALPYGRLAAEALWIAGTLLQLGLALTIFRRWIVENVTITHASPAWFIPVVGNIVVPIAGAPLGYMEVSWFFFAVGLVFWLVLFPVVLNRIIFHDQLPGKFLPTLFILMAPPAIGLVAYAPLLDGAPLDVLGRVLFFAALFIALLLATMARLFLAVPYAVGWWAYTFPSAALAGAGLIWHADSGGTASAALASVLLLAATAIIAMVVARTVRALFSGRLFAPEP